MRANSAVMFGQALVDGHFGHRHSPMATLGGGVWAALGPTLPSDLTGRLLRPDGCEISTPVIAVATTKEFSYPARPELVEGPSFLLPSVKKRTALRQAQGKRVLGGCNTRMNHIIVIDEGTTSTRAMLFSAGGTPLGSAQREFRQHYPGPGLVEHDAAEIWNATLACTRDMIAQAGGAAHIACIGITNQRETIVFWDRTTGEPLAPAIVWQDRRTADDCAALKAAGHENAAVQAKTGLLLDPYFSGSKIGWALRHWPQLREAGDRLAVGTIESYLIFRLTGGVHVTDATNASRHLADGHQRRWRLG